MAALKLSVRGVRGDSSSAESRKLTTSSMLRLAIAEHNLTHLGLIFYL
jgi:hypothetical protein